MHKKTVIFIMGVITTLIFLLLTWDPVLKHFGILIRVNHVFYDNNLKLFHKKNKSDTVIIVDVDDKSLQLEGRWPWSRSKVATLVKNLQNDGAAVIAFDVLFPEEEPNIANTLLSYCRANKTTPTAVTDYLAQQLSYFENDKILADALRNTDIVLGVFFNNDLPQSAGQLGLPILDFTNHPNTIVLHATKFIGNIPVLADAVHYTGFTTTTPDEDGFIRRSPLLIEYNRQLYPSLALEALRAYLLTKNFSLDLRNTKEGEIFLGVNLGDIYIPTDFAGNILINYIGPAFSFPYISAANVVNNKFTPHTFAGKIVLIGSSAVGIGDLHSTPLQAIGYPGTEISANIITSILDRNIISSPLWMVGVERILILLIGLIITILAMYFSAFGLAILILIATSLIFSLNALLLIQWNWVLPHIMLPYLQILFLGIIHGSCGYIFETRYRKKLHHVYGQYVSTSRIDKMLESPKQYTLEGSTKNMTVLFADVRNFTPISEKLDASGVKKFLNTLFTPLTKIIFEFQGTIDKYVGDMIIAFWNDPINDPEHAAHGVKAALMMQQKVRELASVFAEQNLTKIGIRIGINSGTMHVGDMGSEYRKTYTVLGDAVNLASRLEGVNKIYGTDILVSETTKNECSDIVFRFIDCIYVKGKKEPTNIYEPLSLLKDQTTVLANELSQYHKALEFYNANNWAKAKEEFAKLSQQYPHTELYSIYLNRVSQYEISSPPSDWDRGQHLVEK